MFKRLIVMALLFLCVPVAALAQHSFSLFGSQSHHDITLAPWYTYDGIISIDTRYNFDKPETWAGLVGKNISIHHGSKFSISSTPYIGVMAGDAHGLTIQMVTSASHSKASLMVWDQYAWMARPSYDYRFTLFSGGVKVLRNIVPGIDIKRFVERRQDTYWSIGPTVKISTKKTAMKLRVTWDPQRSGNCKVDILLGYVL